MVNKQIKSDRGFLLIDDHDAILRGIAEALRQAYPAVEVAIAKTLEEVQHQLEQISPELVITDLSIPASTADEFPLPDTGIKLLRQLLDRYPDGNFAVQTAHVRTLIRIKPRIDQHHGGFTITDKSLPLETLLQRIEWALQGVVYTPPEMRTALEVKPEWIEMLRLAFQEGLQDRAIAQKLHVAERSVRHYWRNLQDALEVYPEEGKNTRIQTGIRAREVGLLD
ncbi:MAG: response regulator [Leptolyngbyaceae cyanobacterium]